MQNCLIAESAKLIAKIGLSVKKNRQIDHPHTSQSTDFYQN